MSQHTKRLDALVAVPDLLTKNASLLLAEQNQLLAQSLSEIDTPVGQQRVKDVLAARPFPHFEDVPGQPDLLLRIEKDGTRTVGQFAGRQFVETPISGS